MRPTGSPTTDDEPVLDLRSVYKELVGKEPSFARASSAGPYHSESVVDDVEVSLFSRDLKQYHLAFKSKGFQGAHIVLMEDGTFMTSPVVRLNDEYKNVFRLLSKIEYSKHYRN